MTQQQGRGGRSPEASRREHEQGSRTDYYRADRGDEDERASWMHDKHRQAARTGRSDYAYEPQRGREYGHASGDDQGRDYRRGGEYSRQHSGERDDPHDYYDSGWRAGGFDERSQTVGWEDDRGDAPGRSPPSQRGSGRFQGQGERGIRGGESAGRGGREPLDHDIYGSRGDDYQRSRSSGPAMGDGYGRSSGYADRGGDDRGFAGSAYGAGFEANRDFPRGGSTAGSSAYREQGTPSYRGRGPRNYARSDERIAEDLNERLTDDDLLDASDIEVRCSEGKIVLEGQVSTRWMKHRAEDIADACAGVKDVDNRIRVGNSDHAVLAAGPESTGRGASSSSTTAGQGTASAGRAGTGVAGGGGNPGTSAGTSGTGTGTNPSSPGSAPNQPH